MSKNSFYVFLTSPYALYFLFLRYKKCCKLLARDEERGHPCLTPDLSGKALIFPPMSRLLAVIVLVDGLCRVEEVLLHRIHWAFLP